MPKVSAAEIFRPKMTEAEQKKNIRSGVVAFKNWKILQQEIYSPLKLCDKVASTSIFIYPDRVKQGNLSEYRHKVTEYMSGILRSLQFISKIPSWTFRLYVDYSVILARDHGDPNVAEVCKFILDVIDDYQTQFPLVFQIYGVRNIDTTSSGLSSSFIASLWRFLPLFDSNVNMMLCGDADNPFNSLYLHLAESHWQDSDRYFMIVPDNYGPEQCVVHAALNLDSPSAFLCVIAQLWGGKKTAMEDTSQTIDDPLLFTKLLEIMRDPEIRQLWSCIDELKCFRPEFLKIISDTEALKGIIYSKSWEELRESIVDALQYFAKHTQSKMRDAFWISDSMKRVLSKAASNRKIAGYLAFMTFPTLISKFFPPARFLYSSSFKDVIIPVVLQESYGLDEWLLHVLYDEVSQKSEISLLRTSDARMGLQFMDVRMIQRDDPGNLINLLNDIVGYHYPPYGEIVARTLAFLRIILPKDPDQTIAALYKKIKNDYYRRLYLLASETFSASKMDFNRVYKLFDSLYYNETFERQSLRSIYRITEAKTFNDWIERIGAKYDQKRKLFSYDTVDAFAEIKKICLQGVFVDFRMLHLFKHSESVNAQMIPW